jgi:hypothetical protein
MVVIAAIRIVQIQFKAAKNGTVTPTDYPLMSVTDVGKWTVGGP